MLYALWCAAIVVKGGAACRMAVNGIARVLPLGWCYVGCTFVFVTLLLAFSPFPSLYLATYSISVPFLLAAECAAAASIFWALTRNFQNFRMIGTAILCTLTVVGTGAAWAISFLTPPVHAGTTIVWLWYSALVVQRYISMITAVVLLSVLLLLPRSPGHSMPRFAIHAAWIMIFDALMRLTAIMLVRLYGFSHPWTSAFVPLIQGILTGFAWLTLRNYEEKPIGMVTPEETKAQNGRLAFERNSIRVMMADTIGVFRRTRL
jgi:hypothetical protein